MMDSRVQVFLLVISIQILLVAAQTNEDFAVLKSLKDVWDNTPHNWEGLYPCRNGWVGIQCTNSRVTAITLASIGLTGKLSGDLSLLSELQTLDLSYNKDLTGPLPASIGSLKKLTNLILVGCSFSGQIPSTIGSLQQLLILSLNSNSFSGSIPPEIGYLSYLSWLDLSDNKLSGRIPVSNGTTPGLDMLVNTKRLLFNNNNLNGSIPLTLGRLQSLEVLRLDRNLLTGPVPSNLNNLVQVRELFLSNNQLSGSLPNLTGMNVLNYVDMSNNTFDELEIPPWFSTLQSLTTLNMENTRLKGQVPVSLFSLPLLQTVVLRNNQLNGTLDLGSNYSDQLQRIDFQNNLIVAFIERAGFKNKLILAGNPVCQETEGTKTYCAIQQSNLTPYSTPEKNCVPSSCSINQISSPNCVCAYPYRGNLYFRAPSFSDLRNSSIYTSLEDSLMHSFKSRQLPVDTVSLSNPTKNADDYLVLRLEAFPSGEDRFDRTEIPKIAFVLSTQAFKPPHTFGPFYFIADAYFAGHRKSSNIGIVIGAAAGGSVLLLLALLVGIYASRKKRRLK